MAKKEIIFTIKDGGADVQLGEGWPPGAEAANEAANLLKGFDVTVISHRPHHHRDESVKTQVNA